MWNGELRGSRSDYIPPFPLEKYALAIWDIISSVQKMIEGLFKIINEFIECALVTLSKLNQYFSFCSKVNLLSYFIL